MPPIARQASSSGPQNLAAHGNRAGSDDTNNVSHIHLATAPAHSRRQAACDGSRTKWLKYSLREMFQFAIRKNLILNLIAEGEIMANGHFIFRLNTPILCEHDCRLDCFQLLVGYDF